MRRVKTWKMILVMALGLYGSGLQAQCPGIYDYLGNSSNNPEWYSCSGNDYTLNLTVDEAVGNWEINWGDGSALQNGASLVANEIVTHFYPATVQSYTVTFTDIDDGCSVTGSLIMEESSTASIQIPVGAVTQSCAPQQIEFINSSTNVSINTEFIWDFGDGSPTETYDHTNLGQTIAHTYQKGTVDCETQVILTAANLCNNIQGGPSSNIFTPILVYDIDQAQIGVSANSVCWPENTFDFTNTSLINCLPEGNIEQRYEYWNLGDYWGQGQDSIVDWTAFPPSPTYSISFPAVGSYTVMMIDSNFCGQDTTYTTVNIVNPPVSGLSATPNVICTGESINFTNSSSADANAYLVNFDDGNGWTGIIAGNFTHTFNTPGTYDIGLVAYVLGSANTCSDTTWVSITVDSGPVADFSLSQYSSCGPTIIDINDNSTGATIWDWDFGNTSTSSSPNPGSQVYSASGSYDVTLLLESLNGCQNSHTETLNIYDAPTADFSFSASCDGDTVFFNNLSMASPTELITSYDWDFDDGFNSTAENPYHTFATSGTYQVHLTVNTPNCTNDTTITVNIADGSAAGFTPSISNGCSPLNIELINTTANAGSYNWDLGDGTSTNITSPSHEYLNTSNSPIDYTITLYTNNDSGCSDTIQHVITVNPLPFASFSMVSGSPCSPIAVDFVNSSAGADSYLWEFELGQVSSQTSPSYLFTNELETPITYHPTLVATNSYGCTDTTTKDITIYPDPSYSIDLSGFNGCSPVVATMPEVADAVSYHWDFGNNATSILANPTQIFVNSTTENIDYTITLIATNSFGCPDTTTSVITVYPNAKSQFLPNQVAGCSPLTIDFTDSSTGAESYNWDFGDGEVSDNIGNTSHTFINQGLTPVDYTITLEVTTVNGCANSNDVSITVFPEVNVSFDNDPAGCSPFIVEFDNTSSGSISYFWSFGDGTVSQNSTPIHQYVNTEDTDQEFEIFLVGTSLDGCVDTTYKTITVYKEATASFLPDVIQGCSPLELELTNETAIGSTYTWDYGNGNSSTNGDPIHTVDFTNLTEEPITYTIQLETNTEHGCTAQSDQEIIVFPELVASFMVGPEYCAGIDVIFTNTSVGATQYTWQFGDGNQSNEFNPIYNYSNTTGSTQLTPILLTAQSEYGCTNATFSLISVFSEAVADFNIDSTSVCYPLYLELANNSQNATTYSWNYGDGETSSTDALLHDHTYTNDGDILITNTIELTATTDHGCTAVTSEEVQVIPELIANFEEIDDACHPLPVSFTNLSQGALEYQWTLDYEEITDEFEPNYTYVNYGYEDETYNVSLVVSSYFGCTDTLIRPVVVHPIPDAEFTVTPTLQTYPDATVEILDNSVYGSADFTWSITDGFTSNTAITSHTFDEPGSYFIELVIDNGFCSDQIIQRVDILAPAPISIFEGEGEGCTDLSVSFNNLSIYAEAYFWNFGDGSTSEEENPTHIYTVAGDYDVSLVVSGTGGNDLSLQEDIVHAYPHAIADFTPNPEMAQTGDPIFFYNLSENASIYEWDFGNGLTSTESNPTIEFDNPGLYSVTLIANNEHNCPDSLYMADILEIEIGGFVNFPNAFTPSITGPSDENYNPESLDNNVFHPTFAGVAEYNLQIYNRWGELLFETNDINKGWNGYYQDHLVPLGVYVWRADVTFTDDKQIVRTGDITLLR